MPVVTAVLLSLCVVFIVVGVALKVSIDTGRMVLIEHLKDDWAYRLPFRLRNNRYKGLSRPCYQLLAIFYYIVKAIIIIILCAYYYILAGLLIAIKWFWWKLQRSNNSETACIEQKGDLKIVANNARTDKDSQSTLAQKQPPNSIKKSNFTNQSTGPSKSAISNLWNHGSEIAWHEALDYYYELLRIEEQALDRYMETVDANEIAQLSAAEFYHFLYNKYFVWKYTAKNRLETTRKSLRRYMDENRLFELADIQDRLFSADRLNIEKCLSIATEIRGLGPAGASGLLSILFPESFGTIDQYLVRALREVEGLPYNTELAKMNPDSLSIKDGVLLIRILREQAARLNKKFATDFWTPRKIDMVLWAIGRVR